MLASAFIALLAVSLYRCRYVLPSLCTNMFGARYFFPLQLIALWLLLAATKDSRVRVARGSAMLAVWILAINLSRLREPALTNLQWPVYAEKLRSGEAVTVPINPVPWTFDVPAQRKK